MSVTLISSDYSQLPFYNTPRDEQYQVIFYSLMNIISAISTVVNVNIYNNVWL
jgi:hypothetical protein